LRFYVRKGEQEMTLLKIDDVMKETGLTKRTIRYYEEIGLIQPPERSNGNIRLYTEEDVERIKKVVEAREILGFSLQELQHFLMLKESMEQRRKSENPRDREVVQNIAEQLQEQITMLNEKIGKMIRFKEELEKSLQKAQNFLQKK
jgi:DNA-binding transcriptional MerR regulator